MNIKYNSKKTKIKYREDTDDVNAVYEPPRGQQLLSGCLASFRYVAVIFSVSIIFAAIALSFVNDVFSLVKEEAEIEITIKNDFNIDELSQELKEGGIIKYATLFKFYMRFTDKEDGIAAGTYTLSSKMDYRALAKAIQEKAAERQSIDIVVPEGYTQDEIFTLLETSGVCSKDELIEAASNYDFKYTWVMSLEKGEKRLEGFLFPDTYTFYIEDKATRVIGKFLANFNKKYDVEFKTRVSDLEMPLQDIINIAAMIEKEAKSDADRPYISSVIYNRLSNDKFPYLQVDATVIYAIGKHKTELTKDDLTYKSDYNTYVTEGLPAGPICNPGLESMLAALYPEETDYYYYVARIDGSHYFSETLSEHNAAIKKAEAERLEAETSSETESETESEAD